MEGGQTGEEKAPMEGSRGSRGDFPAEGGGVLRPAPEEKQG